MRTIISATHNPTQSHEEGLPPLSSGKDMEPYERSELGGVGEGLWVLDRAFPCSLVAGRAVL